MNVKKRKQIFTGCLAGVIVLAVTALVFQKIHVTQSGTIAEVQKDGEVLYQLDLQQETEITIEEEGTFNRIVVKDGVIFVKEADCPDQVCVQTKPIKHSLEVIACLPHRLLIVIQ